MYPRLVWCPVCKRFDKGPHFHVRKAVDNALDRRPGEARLPGAE